jgi:hypothetical protein
MNNALLEHLKGAGIEPEKAEAIAKGFVVPETVDEEDTVDVEQLTKAMSELSDTMEKGYDTDFDVEEASVEVGVVEALAKASDILLEEHREQNSAIAQALLRIGEEIVELRQDFGQLAKGVGGVQDEVQKSLEAVEDSINTPLLRKSVDSEVEVIDHPGDVVTAASAPDLLTKALGEMKNGVDKNRGRELRQAVALLEIPGTNVSEIATRFGLH